MTAEERRRAAALFMAGRRRRSRKDGRGSGRIPFGYRLGADDTVEIDEQAANVVRLVLSLRVDHTLQETADILNAGGYRAPRGGTWTTGTVQYIESHTRLYTTGGRIWAGIESQQLWPIIFKEGAEQ